MNSKKGLMKSGFAILLVAALMFFAVPGTVKASEAGFNYYRVQSGDYLWLIGWKFETTVEAIMTANSLNSTSLVPDQVLKIPVSTGFVRDLPQTAAYKVKQGDTLYLIGERFGVSAQDLINANALTSSMIYPGQALKVPLPPQQRYTVKSGDSLYLIAQNYKVDIELLKLVNRLNSDTVWVGQVLFVPAANLPSTEPSSETPVPAPEDQSPISPGLEPHSPDPVSVVPYGGQWASIPDGVILYKVQPGENLWVIANRFKTTMAAIKETNHLHSDLLNVNQPLFVPQNSSQPVSIAYPYASQKEGYGELLDWQYVYWVLNTGNTATIQDLATGKSFTVRRLGGSNHADMEPLTASDTAIMKTIYGGQWSWDRRAVLVKVDGKVIAGSMAGMPHDVQTITDNGFNGHFDLHFLNSTTHNTNSLDTRHQEMVQKAAGN